MASRSLGGNTKAGHVSIIVRAGISSDAKTPRPGQSQSVSILKSNNKDMGDFECLLGFLKTIIVPRLSSTALHPPMLDFQRSLSAVRPGTGVRYTQLQEQHKDVLRLALPTSFLQSEESFVASCPQACPAACMKYSFCSRACVSAQADAVMM